MSMDIISYGVANKAALEQKKTESEILAIGVEGPYSNVKDRIDALEEYTQENVRVADDLIIKDAINIMKANAKLNVIAKSKRYKMTNMIFEDFLDNSGIDTAQSNGYTIDATAGLIKASGAGPYTIITTLESLDSDLDVALLEVEEFGHTGNIIPNMQGSTQSPAGSAKDQSGTYSSIYDGFLASWSAEPYHVFDGDINTYWVANGATNHPRGWIGVKFPTARVIKKIAMRSHNGTSNGAPNTGPKTFTVEGSNNKTDWVVLYTGNKSSWGRSERAEFGFDNETPYIYYRVNITANTGYMTMIAEIEMMEGTSAKNLLGKYTITQNNGATWEKIQPGELYYFEKKSPLTKQLRLKAEMPTTAQLLNYGLTWS